jgi:uncharacterized protein (TIGR03435 family)
VHEEDILKLHRLAIFAIASMLPAAIAQTPSLPSPEDAHLQFEVASIRLTKPDERGGGIKATAGGDGYTASGVPVQLMIALMYRIPNRQIKGAPDWLAKDRYNIEAKADQKYNLDQLHAMYQNMLIDRFKLKYHLETKEANAYVLTVDKSGLKMTPNNQSQDFNIPWIPNGIGTVKGTRVPVPYLCWNLGQILQDDERPVVDETGLKGFYDFNLSFLPQNIPEQFRATLPQDVLDRPGIIVALHDQLGLKLTAQKGQVTYFVIDHIERPTEN